MLFLQMLFHVLRNLRKTVGLFFGDEKYFIKNLWILILLFYYI